MNLVKWINGRKTYIGLIAAGVFGLAISADWIKWEDYEWLAVLIGTWTGVAITHKSAKLTDALLASSGTSGVMTLAATEPRNAPLMPLTSTMEVRQGDTCDQCSAIFMPGDRIFQRAAPPTVVCSKCAKVTDLFIGKIEG